MKSVIQLLSYLLPVLYFLVLYVYYTIFSERAKSLANKTTLFLIALLFIHAVEIAGRHIILKTIPLSTAHDAFSFLAFSILFVYMIIEISLNNRGSGLFILSFASLLELIAIFKSSWQAETNELLTNPFFAVHASISIMGYTALALSAVYSLMYIIQNRNLKTRRIGVLFNQLPPLTYLEKMSVYSVVVGIILLGVGIVLGHIQAYRLLGSLWPKDIKVIITDSIWLVYLFGFLLARRFKWPAKWMARISLYAFLSLIIGALFIIYLTQSFHKFN